MPGLIDLIDDDLTGIDAIAVYLDGLAPHERWQDWRLQRFVYHQTRDFMRRVSRDVSIGAAFKREKSLDHSFVLCRRPPAS